VKKKMKWILGGIVAIVIVLAALFQGSRPLEVKTLEVLPREIAKTFEEEGLVVTENETIISAPLGGKIAAIPVKEGDRVLAGELLAVLDSRALNFELEDLQGQLRSLKAQWETEKSGIGLEKLKQLYEAGAISQKEYQDAKNKVDSDYYPGQIDSLEARIRSVKYQIEESSIKAPEEGIVSELSVKHGQVIAAGNHLMKLFRDQSYLVEVFVLTEDAARLKGGTEVELIQENNEGDTVFKGVVESLAPAAVEKISVLGLREQRVKVTIKPHIPAGLVSLQPGYALDVRFTLDRQKDKLVVPKTALFPYQDGEGIWIVEDGKARVRQVKRGFENEKEVVIEEGLSAGELVLVNPQQEGLREGVRVRR
jgi:HlyD family secretion protein